MDEHPLWLDAVERVLEGVSVTVVGTASSALQATALLSELAPDLLVAEICGPDGAAAGIIWLREIRHSFPDLKTVVLSSSADTAHIEEAFAAGAVAYVIKKAHPDDLAVAVRQAYEHSLYLPALAPTTGSAYAETFEHADLTRRELEILRLAAEGHSNAELAKMLWVTEQTVKFHLSNIYRKLNVSNRTEAGRWAQLNGVLQPLPAASGRLGSATASISSA